MKQIQITIAPDGSSTVETRGFSGVECRSASAWIERALGTSAHEVLKPEFHATEVTTQVEQQRNGAAYE